MARAIFIFTFCVPCFSRRLSTDCTDSYIRETARRLSERVMDHSGRDTDSHIVRHCLNSKHETVNIENLKILNMEFNSNIWKYLRHYL